MKVSNQLQYFSWALERTASCAISLTKRWKGSLPGREADALEVKGAYYSYIAITVMNSDSTTLDKLK